MKPSVIAAVLAASGVLAAGCGDTSSTSSSPTAAAQQMFQLNDGSLGLVIPTGWAARGYQTKYTIREVLMEPEGDSHLESDAQALAAGGSATGAHIIIFGGVSCTGGAWELGPIETGTEGGVSFTGRKAKLLSQDKQCAYAKSGDREASANLSAVKVLEQMTANGAITVTAGGAAPSGS
ncbi:MULTISPECIES: hypothetical protein [Mycobacteriaceae]|uniref:Lipoprotein n=1 Tax=Mycolicibacterium mucogenicum TaxID=56689 RepID=A0A1A0MJE5_MYCMU|nr:hypothetical protein [Mycolicibacterium mucogenicum]OBA85545.1 hypothetical protein A5642_24010 [Mycolicibacterium mucogenicum]